MSQGPDYTAVRFVKGTTLTFVIVITALLGVLAWRTQSVPLGDPRFLVAVPVVAILTSMLIDMRQGVRAHHAKILVWTTVGATWLLGIISQFLGAFQPPIAGAFTILLAVVMLRRNHFLAVLLTNFVASTGTAFAFAGGYDAIRDLVLFNVALSLTSYFVWRALESERRLGSEANDRARNQTDSLRDILDSTQDFMVTLGSDGAVQTANRAAEGWISENFSRPLNEGLPLRTIIPPQLLEEYDRHLAAAMGGEAARWSFEKESNGQRRNYQISFAPLRVNEGVILCGRDVTNVRELRDRAKGAEVTAKQAILNRVSHDISTPLTPILLTTGRLLAHPEMLDADLLKALEMIQRNVRRAVESVQEIVAENSRFSGESLAALGVNRTDVEDPLGVVNR